eukprot:jgi/Undpi1/4105/HiC_scaffold_16.g07472.m1
MAELVEGMIGLYGRQLEAERVSSLAAVVAASDSGTRPATDTLAAAAVLRDRTKYQKRQKASGDYPLGPFVLDSGAGALRVPSAIDSVAATAATADATIITATATATVDRGAGTVDDPLPE